MNIDEISQYFKEVIKNNKSILYCCNREYKKLVGGEELHFDKYPWDNTKKLFWEDCPFSIKICTPLDHRLLENTMVI